MEIKGSGRIDSVTVRRASRTSQGGDSFKVSDTADAPRASTVTGPGPIAAVDNILMLQGMDDSTSGRARAVAHGTNLLEMLDEVRDGLLAGGIPRATLNRIANAVGRRQENFADPKLQGVLDEIELRARVELAKLERADRRVA
ncbi:MAG TPA: flagellar assembly protein FliX [Rhizomicrobium sp.]